MGGKSYRVFLRVKERKQLQALVHKGVQKARVINRARILLMANESIGGEHKSDAEISKILAICLRMVAATREKYWRLGLPQALGEKPRSGHPVKLSGKGEAILTTIACTDAPQGRSRWTLRLGATNGSRSRRPSGSPRPRTANVLKCGSGLTARAASVRLTTWTIALSSARIGRITPSRPTLPRTRKGSIWD